MIPDQLTCPECRAAFNTPAELEQHNRMVHQRFTCETCGQTFNEEAKLNAHNDKMHPAKQNISPEHK